MEKLDITNLVRNFLDTCTVQKKSKPHEPIMGTYGYVFSVLGSAFRVYMLRTTGQMPIQGDTIKKYFVEVFKENYEKGVYGRFQELGHIFYIDIACKHLYLNHIGETYYCLYKTLLFKTTLNRKTLLETENETFTRLVKQKLFKSKAFTTINGASEYLEEPYLSYYNDMLIAEGVVSQPKEQSVCNGVEDFSPLELLKQLTLNPAKLMDDADVEFMDIKQPKPKKQSGLESGDEEVAPSVVVEVEKPEVSEDMVVSDDADHTEEIIELDEEGILKECLSRIDSVVKELKDNAALLDYYIQLALEASSQRLIKEGVIIYTSTFLLSALENKNNAFKSFLTDVKDVREIIQDDMLFEVGGVLPLQQFLSKEESAEDEECKNKEEVLIEEMVLKPPKMKIKRNDNPFKRGPRKTANDSAVGDLKDKR